MKEIEELECEDLVYMFYKNSYEFRKLKVKERTTDYLTVAPLDSLDCSYIIVLKNISNLENNVGIYDYCDTYISTDEHLLKVVKQRLVHLGEYRQRGIDTHGSDGLASV